MTASVPGQAIAEHTARKARHLNVNEVFGPTIQGEGRHAGALSSFLRLSGCNLSCSWCDTPYTWDWSRFDHDAETTRYEVDRIAEVLSRLPGRIVVSGGEPLLQTVALADLMTHPDLLGRSFDVETNGSRPLGATQPYWSTITCSPKIIPSARQDLYQVHPDVEAVADFKFVIAGQADLNAALDWLAFHTIERDRVWLMPEGTSPAMIDSRTPWLMDKAVEHGFNFCTRLHVLGWGDERGR